MEIYVAKSGRETGPFTLEQIQPMVDTGMLSLTDAVWYQDLPSWIPIHQFLNVRPPLPEASAVATPVVDLPSKSGEPALFGRRLGASIIDAVIWFVGGGLLCGFLFELLFGASYATMTDNEVGRLVVLPTLVIGWVYSAALESGPWRATIGKLVFGLVVADAEGRPVDFWSASRRYAGKILVGVSMGLTLLPSAWTRRRQNVHDLLSGTLVLRK